MFNKVKIYLGEDKYLIFIPLLTVLVRLLIYLFIPHTYEDAFITFRYAENFANGNGLVYNIGEYVYGTTTPLFALILGIFKYFGLPCVVSSLIINLISEGITSLIVYKFVKDYSKGILAFIVTLLYIFSPSNISWAIQGMETAFFSALISLAFFSLYKNKYLLALLFGFISSILRIDGLSVPFIIFIFIIVKERLSTFKYIVFPLGLFLLWEIFLFLYYNSFLPNSMIAKLVLYSGHQSSMIPNLELIFSKYFLVGNYTSSIITILFFLGVVIIIKTKLKLLPMIVWFFVYYMALIFSKTHIFGWYLIPPLFVFITVSGIAIILITKKAAIFFNSTLPIYFVLTGVVLFSTFTLYLKIVQIKDEYRYEREVRIKIGKYLDDNTPKKSSIFLEPIGVIGYYSHRYVYDDAALISPIFLKLNELPDNPKTQYKKIQMVNPDFLIIRDKYLSEFYSSTNLFKDYSSIKSFKFNYQSEIDFPSMTIFQKK